MQNIYYLIPVLFIIIILILIILLHFKKKSVLKKIDAMSITQKHELLNTLAELVGYSYNSRQDIFVARQDAPQKLFGYTKFYDFSAPYLNMVFDYETFYFDYDSKTWLIEMWKGQYGINTGCELGIYYADTLLEPEEYSTTLFHAVDAKDILEISLELNYYPTKNTLQSALSHDIGYAQSRHWWLTIFKMGLYTNPKNIFVNTSIRFKNYFMLNQFLDSFEKTLPDTPYKTNGLTLYFTFYQSTRKYSFFKRMVRRFALMSCSIYCKLFGFLTRSYSNSGDKLLYLYYYLPFVVRHMLKSKSDK